MCKLVTGFQSGLLPISCIPVGRLESSTPNAALKVRRRTRFIDSPYAPLSGAFTSRLAGCRAGLLLQARYSREENHLLLRSALPMKFFADTAEIDDIKELAATGLLDGVTTNPSLIHKSGRDFMEVTKEICAIVDGPVSAEVVALDHATMMKEADVLRKIADNVCIKVPLTIDGLKTCKAQIGRAHV